MYELYSQQRPGRPRWTLGASAFVLLLTVGLAAAVSSYKHRALRVPLGKEQIFARGQLRCALPAGWETLPDAELPGIVMRLHESAKESRKRQLFIFRESPRLLGTPSRDGQAALARQLTTLNLFDRFVAIEAARIGVLPAVEMTSIKLIRLRDGSASEISCLSRIATGPDGEMVGVVLAVPGMIEASDGVLIAQVAERLHLLEVKIDKNPDAAMNAAGIRAELDQDVRVFAENQPGASRLRMIGGDETAAWYLTACRVPLTPGRSPEQLVRDFYLNALETTEPADEINGETLGGRAAASLHFSMAGDRPASVLALCAQVDEQTGLLLVGRHEEEGWEGLSRVARALAARAKVSPYAELLDLTRARESSLKWLGQVRDGGLESLLGSAEVRRQTFAIHAPALELGSASRVLTARRAGGQPSWELRVEVQIERIKLRAAEQWDMQIDGAYEYTARQVQAGQRQEYQEKWAGSGPVERELTGDGLGSTHLSTHVDALFVSEPLLVAAAGALSDGKNAGQLFSTTQAFLPELCYWALRPIGAQAVPGGGESARAVLLQRDFEPWPIVLYFDEDHMLLAMGFPGGQYHHRTKISSRGDADDGEIE